ncbi:regulator of nonsense transcripts 3B [Engraulis encrasicolus]|uniref:regulator of nonsense transcripts 3B n=1 Tax=Engraulis encrasicolus TaxID=184585 RepID=UPI002FD1E9A5
MTMKEDKENTRPREKKVDMKCDDTEKPDKPCSKEKKEAMTKIVIRRLPPSLTKEELEEQLQPMPEVDYLEFFSNDTSLFPHYFSRAYLNFKNQDDIVLFRDRFDGYVFIDSRGQEYPAIVEFAPFQKVAKRRSKKKDAKTGTIEEDGDYRKFLEFYNGENDEKLTSTPETLLEELEAKTKELISKKTTPLLDFLKNKQRIREEKKEERKRRELERKRLRDEERRKWREEDRRKRKEAEKLKKAEKALEKEKEQSKDEPRIKLLKKPEKADEGDGEKPREKVKKTERERDREREPKAKEERGPPGPDLKKRQNGENREERTPRKVDDEGRKDYRDRDADRDRDRDRERDRERERRQKEKERIRRQDEDRRRRRDHHDGENAYKKREEDGGGREREKRERWEKRRNENSGEGSSHQEARNQKPERPPKDHKKDDAARERRLRNKDRPAIQLYQPGARSRRPGPSGDTDAANKKTDGGAPTNQDKGEE